jgi:hypothetical protein
METLDLVIVTSDTPESASVGGYSDTKSDFGDLGNQNTHVVDILPLGLHSNPNRQIRSLRACYSRLLIRISQLLWLHTYEKITIEPYFLDRLLSSIHTTARWDALNPLDSISTHHPQTTSSKPQDYHFVVPLASDTSYSIRSTYLTEGPLGALIAILTMCPKIKEESLIQTRMAALYAFSALAPVLLQQLFGLNRDELLVAFNFRAWPYTPIADMQGIRYIAARQMLLVLRYIGSCLPAATRHIKFCDVVTELIYDYLEEDTKEPGYQGPRLAIAHNCTDLIPLLEFAGASDSNHSKLTKNMMFNLVDTVRLPLSSKSMTPCDTLLTPSCFPPLIRIIGRTKNSVSGAGEMLDAMVRRMRRTGASPQQQQLPWNDIPSIEYLHCFTQTSQGFSALANAGRHKKYAEVVASAIADIAHLAAGRDRSLSVKPVELRTPAVPGFLDVALIVAKHCSGVADRDTRLLKFSKDALALITVASKDEESKKLVAEHPAYREMYAALKAVGDKIAAHDSLELLKGELGITNEGEWRPFISRL